MKTAYTLTYGLKFHFFNKIIFVDSLRQIKYRRTLNLLASISDLKFRKLRRVSNRALSKRSDWLTMQKINQLC